MPPGGAKGRTPQEGGWGHTTIRSVVPLARTDVAPPHLSSPCKELKHRHLNPHTNCGNHCTAMNRRTPGQIWVE